MITHDIGLRPIATLVRMVILALGVSIVLQVLVVPSALAFPIVPVNGRQPMAISVNNATGLAYTANNASNSVSIIGKDFFAFMNMTVGTQPISIAVNNRTNVIYVANNGSNTVTLINGSTNTLKVINVGNRPAGVAANPTTGRAYVANNGSSTVTVIIPGGTYTLSGAPFNFNKPVAVAANPSASQNRTLVANIGDNSVTVIPKNGLAYKLTSAVYGFSKPVAIAINPVTNYTYIANNGTNTISVIKGDGTHWTIGVGNNPVSIAVDPVFNRTVVVNQGDNSITQIKADSSMWTILGFKKPVAVAINPNTNSTYIVNGGNSTVSIIPGGSFGGFNPAIPAAPTNPSLSAGATQVTLSWNNPFYNGTSPLTNFIIQRNLAPGMGASWSTLRTCCLLNKSAIITGLSGTIPIGFRIEATNAAGTGPASFPVLTVPGNTITQFLQPPPAPPSSIITAMIAKGVGFTSTSNFQMPSPIFVSNTNFNPFKTFQLAQNLTFTTAAPTVSPTLFSDYGIQSYSPPSNWNPSTVWTIPPSIIPVSGGLGDIGAFSLSQATAGKPFFMPMTSATPLPNGGAVTGTQISVGSNSSNLQVSSQFINTPPPGVQPISNAAMYLNFTLHDATGLNYGSSSTFSSPPTIYFTLGPIAGSVINSNTVNSAIQCPNVALFLLQSTSSTNSGITVTRNPSGDTATVCGYSATVQHFSSYGVVGNPTVIQSEPGDVVPTHPSLAGSAYGSNEYPITIAGKGFVLPSLYTPITTNIIKTGQATPIKLLIYSSSGPSAMQHVTLFMNLNGNKKNVADSDTAILYDTTSTHPLQIVDPNGFFGPVTASTTTNNGKFELDLNVTFLKPMATSDVIIRTWDTYLNSIDVQVANAIQVVGTQASSAVASSQNPNTSSPTTPTPSTTTPSTTTTPTSDVVMGAIKDWGGYSPTPITDSQFLSDLGLQGSHIPQWVAKTTKWVVDGEISQQDFQAALNYMAKNSIIR